MIKLLGALIGTIAVVLTLYLYFKFEEKEEEQQKELAELEMKDKKNQKRYFVINIITKKEIGGKYEINRYIK